MLLLVVLRRRSGGGVRVVARGVRIGLSVRPRTVGIVVVLLVVSTRLLLGVVLVIV